MAERDVSITVNDNLEHNPSNEKTYNVGSHKVNDELLLLVMVLLKLRIFHATFVGSCDDNHQLVFYLVHLWWVGAPIRATLGLEIDLWDKNKRDKTKCNQNKNNSIANRILQQIKHHQFTTPICSLYIPLYGTLQCFFRTL